jgi:hypothetical protein
MFEETTWDPLGFKVMNAIPSNEDVNDEAEAAITLS